MSRPEQPPSDSASAQRRFLSARIAAIERHNGPDDPRLPELRRQLGDVRLEQYIRRAVDDAPPLSHEQRARLSAILRGRPLPPPDLDDGGEAA